MATLDQVLSLCLQGNVEQAFRIARKIRVQTLQKKKDSLFLEKFKRRFAALPRKRQPADFVSDLIRIYEAYWHQVLMGHVSPRVAEKLLYRDLVAFLGAPATVFNSKSFDKLEAQIKRKLSSMGFHCLLGEVSPYRELEIWRKQRVKTHRAPLQGGTQTIQVVLLSDFVCKGWMAYATMGRFYPGGWANKDGVYCNTEAYNLKAEKFRVSLVAHEAQHFADYKKFPKLQQIDLEYRAKLTEFLLAKRTARSMYRVFSSRAEYNKASPHAFANYCVVRDLAHRITGGDDFHNFATSSKCASGVLNRAAGALLAEHTDALSRRGARRVKAFIQ